MTPTPIIPKADEGLSSCPFASLVRAARAVNASFDNAERFESIGEHRLDLVWELGRALAALRNTRAPSPAVGGEVIEEEVERFLKTSYRDIDWSYGTIEDALQACQPHVVRGWVRAALEAFVRGRVKP